MSEIKVYKDNRIVKIVKDLTIQVGMDGAGIIVMLDRYNSFGNVVYINEKDKEVCVDFDVRMGDTSVKICGVLVGPDDIETMEMDSVGATGFGKNRIKKVHRPIHGKNWRA